MWVSGCVYMCMGMGARVSSMFVFVCCVFGVWVVCVACVCGVCVCMWVGRVCVLCVW